MSCERYLQIISAYKKNLLKSYFGGQSLNRGLIILLESFSNYFFGRTGRGGELKIFFKNLQGSFIFGKSKEFPHQASESNGHAIALLYIRFTSTGIMRQKENTVEWLCQPCNCQCHCVEHEQIIEFFSYQLLPL